MHGGRVKIEREINTSHVVVFDIYSLVTLFTIGACLDNVDVYDLVYMGPEIFSWIHFGFIFIPPRFSFLLCGLPMIPVPCLD